MLRSFLTAVGLFFVGCPFVATQMACNEAGLRGGDTTAHRPGVKVVKNWLGFSFEVSADVDAEVEKLRVDPVGGVDLTGGRFGQRVGPAIRAEAVKLGAMGDFVLKYAKLAEVRWAGGAALAREFMPLLTLIAGAGITKTTSGLQLTLPNGASIGRTKIVEPGDLTGYISAAMQRLREHDAAVAAEAAAARGAVAAAGVPWINPAFEAWLAANDPALLATIKAAANRMVPASTAGGPALSVEAAPVPVAPD